MSNSRLGKSVGPRHPLGCQRPGCGHPESLHRNGTSRCTAFACTAGPDETPCPEYLAERPARAESARRIA